MRVRTVLEFTAQDGQKIAIEADTFVRWVAEYGHASADNGATLLGIVAKTRGPVGDLVKTLYDKVSEMYDEAAIQSGYGPSNRASAYQRVLSLMRTMWLDLGTE